MKNKVRILSTAALTLLLVAGWDFHPDASATVPGINLNASLDSSGNQSNNSSSLYLGHTISGDGRYTVFSSNGTNLVSSDTNAKQDIFVRDRVNSTTTRVSVSSSGAQSNDTSGGASISYGGRYIVFESAATNLVASDTNSHWDIFERDLQTGTTSLVSQTATGTQGNADSSSADVSADGRFVVFSSSSTNLVSGFNPTGVGQQIFMKDMQTGAIKAISQSTSGYAPNGTTGIAQINCSGNVVVFSSNATNLVASDTNGVGDVFIDVIGWSGDKISDITATANAASDSSSISCDGNELGYRTQSTNIISNPSGSAVIVKYDRENNVHALESTATGSTTAVPGESPQISGDGHYIVFKSDASTALDSSKTYAGGGTLNIFIRDTVANTTQVVTLDSTGVAAGNAYNGGITGDGKYVDFQSAATTYTSSDTNGYQDVFIAQTGF